MAAATYIVRDGADAMAVIVTDNRHGSELGYSHI